jgi:hypothetical protein
MDAVHTGILLSYYGGDIHMESLAAFIIWLAGCGVGIGIGYIWHAWRY